MHISSICIRSYKFRCFRTLIYNGRNVLFIILYSYLIAQPNNLSTFMLISKVVLNTSFSINSIIRQCLKFAVRLAKCAGLTVCKGSQSCQNDTSPKKITVISKIIFITTMGWIHSYHFIQICIHGKACVDEFQLMQKTYYNELWSFAGVLKLLYWSFMGRKGRNDLAAQLTTLFPLL